MLLLPATLTSREARVTLRMLQQALQSEGSEAPVVEIPDLLGEDDPHEIAARLTIYPEHASIALVGHEPHLAMLEGTYLASDVPVRNGSGSKAACTLPRTAGSKHRT